MKIFLLLTCVLIASSSLSFSQELQNFEEDSKPKKQEKPAEEQGGFQDQHVEEIPDHLKFYKEKHTAIYEKSFNEVYNAIIEVLTELGCEVMQKKESMTDEGFYKGSIQSEMCVFAEGSEQSPQALKKYSYNQPVIRGADWKNARMQYKFVLKEQEDGTVDLLLKGELSAMEGRVTNQVHFWQSNGIFETQFLEKLATKLQ